MKNTSQYIAEFIGTFFMVLFACGAIILASLDITPSFMIPIIFGGTITIMIYAVGHISGAHFNPAVTIAFCVARKFPMKKVPFYILAQVLGATFASYLHYLRFGPLNHNFGATTLSVSLPMGMGIEFILSFVLMFVIISVATDTRAVGELAGLAIGLTVALCAFIGGPDTGASMNPARSFGPALFNGTLSQTWMYFIVPILGTISGALVYEKIRCESDKEADHGCC
ncbi:MAG: aquaporin [Epsilonproteobacteria bacterium]|nr:MAG: aquaporin [Campylobacterota bacterium]RLA67261.1 MAG: aquaporin [Campylobacterota bacterium]